MTALTKVNVAEKSNEIVAIPSLLAMLGIAGAIVTIDAMGCQQRGLNEHTNGLFRRYFPKGSDLRPRHWEPIAAGASSIAAMPWPPAMLRLETRGWNCV
jgi:predicted transposase YbfD/YdcC